LHGSYVVVSGNQEPGSANRVATISTQSRPGRARQERKSRGISRKKKAQARKPRGNERESFNQSCCKEAKIDIIEDGRGSQAVHELFVAMRAARVRVRQHEDESGIDMSARKPWRQKGTGRWHGAGYVSSPIWRGGGVVFGPKPRDYSKKVSKSVRRLALQKALSERSRPATF